MKKMMLAVATVALCATGFAMCLKSGDSVAWLGDSITWLGAFPDRPGYVNLCAAALKANGLDIKMHPRGVSGHKSDQMLARLPGILALKPTYLTLSCGVNDVWHGERGVSLPHYKENVTKIIDQAQAAGVKVILFTATMIKEDATNELNKKLVPYNDFLRQIAKEKGCALVDMNAEMRRQIADYRRRSGITTNFLTTDGVHMGFLGDVMMARMVLTDGFQFTAAEMKKADAAIGEAVVRVGTCPGSRSVYTGDACITGRLYLDIVEGAIADKLEPNDFIRRRFNVILAEAASKLFWKNIVKGGFHFTEAEKKTIEDEDKSLREKKLSWRKTISIARNGEAAFLDRVALDLNLYYGVLKRAKESGMTPEAYLTKYFGHELNAGMEKLFKDACYFRTDAGRVPHPRVACADLPVWDISKEAARQTVIAAGTAKAYQGHPTTVRADDGTLFAVWTLNHGGLCGPIAESKDNGKTWTRVDERMPKSYSTTHKNCPCIYRIVGPDGKARLMIFTNLPDPTGDKQGLSEGKFGIGRMMSEDNGKTWRELPMLPIRSAMPFTGMLRLKDGSTAVFGQTQVQEDGLRKATIFMCVSADGGFTWSTPQRIAFARGKALCEPFAFRSDDGNEIGVLIRENCHNARSMMVFSRDEGKTWTEPLDTCRGLTGDRHQGVRTKDGRWVIAFRDRAINSPTFGQFVAWVGTYDDIRHARPGQCRIHLLHHRAAEAEGKNSWRIWDTGYPGMEILNDGTILATTYTRHTPEKIGNSVVMTRFNLNECDAK